MAFETFKRSSRRSSEEPHVSVQKRGSISLNTAAYELLKGPHRAPPKKHPRRKNDSDIFVELLFDKENQTIGLHYTMPDNPDSFIVRKPGKSNTYLVSAKGFLKHFNIRPTKTRRFVAKGYGPDMLVVSVGGSK